MKTSYAHAWKSLTSKLHAPLPLSPRDSQRLLSLLNASFKQQLDRQHLADSSSNEHHANLHLQSILTNPLFAAKPRTRVFSNKNQCSGMDLGQLQNHLKRPMDAFKERVSQGTADLATAKFLLGIQFHDCLGSAAATPREAMQASGAASTVLQWLWSSGREDTGEFLNDRKFVSLLVRFLVADGQHSRVLRWMHRYNNLEEKPFSSIHQSDTYEIQRRLLAVLIYEEMLYGDGLESAMALFVRTVAGLRSSGATKGSMQDAVIKGAWILIKNVLRIPKAPKLDPNIVRSFMETMRGYQADPLLNALLCIHIQERPDPQPTLTYLQNQPIEAVANLSAGKRPRMVLLGLRAAELFLRDDRQTEALWIMEFLQRNFEQELGSPPPRIHKYFDMGGHQKNLDREEKSLYLLDKLAIQ